jgi:uncharacterized lipoprotein YajG
MSDVKPIINAQYFPSQFVSDAEKRTETFGLRIGQAIQYEWFRRDGGSARYYSQWRDFHRLRLYARGEQSVQKYKNEMAVNGDLSYLNLDWTPVPILPKFVDIVVNGMSDRFFKVKAYAQDAMSMAKRNRYQEMVETQMAGKDIFENLQKTMGINGFTMNPENLPENDDELQLYMQMNYKPAIEIAEEEAVATIMEDNRYSDLRKRIDYDLTVLGVGMGKHVFYPGEGVRVEYVDPANVVYSYTEDPYFRDCFYWGEIKTVPITELKKIRPDLTTEQLSEISKYSQSWYDYYNVGEFYDNSLFRNDTVTLLFFNYKTTNTFTYKKKNLDSGGARVIEKDENFNPPAEMMEEQGFEKISRTIDVWYDGVMVMGTEVVLKWQLMENMVRPKSASQHAVPNYVACAPRMYKGNIESLVRRMIPFADLIQLTHLKLQQVIARVVPDGIFLDADGVNEVDLGNGQAYSPEDALRLYFQTGSVIGRSYTQDGEFNNARVPIQELNSSSGQQKMAALIGNYNHYLGMIRAVTGLNEARDGTVPDSRSLVGVQKLAALNSNTATRHILDGSVYITKSIAEALTCRISDILEYAPYREEFVTQIGRYNVSLLDEIKDLYIYDFGIFIEVAPDEEEKNQLEQNVQMALQKGDINLEDAIDIREIRNIKMANQLLKLKRRKNLENLQAQEMQKQQMTIQGQMEAQRAAAQTMMMKVNAQAEADMRVKQAEVAFDIERIKAEVEAKATLMEREFSYNIELAKAQGQALSAREEAREKEKAKRIGMQNTQQSKLIDQRKNNLPPISFESNEDSLDGFDLAEFEPR